MRDAFIEVMVKGQQVSNAILLAAARYFGTHKISLPWKAERCQD
jgi:hypothetical protein